MAEIKNIQEGFFDLEKGSYLLLVNPDKIPHLVYIQEGKYYSLTFKGVELGFAVAPYFEALVRARKPLLFLALNTEQSKPATVFANYLEAGHEETTCFFPIKEMLLPSSSAKLIFELIPELYENQLIKSAKHFGMAEMISDEGTFVLNEYNKADVDAYIQTLKSKYVER